MNRFIDRQEQVGKRNRTYLKKSKATAQRRVPVTFLILALLIFASQVTLGNWTSFRGNPQLTGVADSQLPENPQLLWTFQAGDMIESTAAVVNGTVYIGALDGIFYALDAQTGEKQWTYQTNSSIKASAAIHNGVAYFGDGEGVFHAVDINTHEMKWQFRTEGEIISSANFAGDRVLFGSYDGFLYCLNRENGELIWKFETEGYVHGTPGVWTKIDSDSGNAENFVIVTGCDSYLRVINIDDGMQTQQVELGAYVGASAAILQDRVYCGTYGTEILSVALDTGEIKWRYRHPKRRFPFFASAALTEDSVIIGGRDKMVHALSPETGESLWTYTAKSRIESSAVIVDTRVFLGTTRGLIIGLDIKTGELVWEFATGSSIVASPSVSNGKIYIGTEDGILYCFG
ncbi:MAG: PQQ-binding-like beta-propeller repeat protein [Candidatus Poribacteria bacterium]|nr:PQQ-binding-like beta-propeller repeat protein [Candidatus Poribacteria bacterium]